MFNIKEIYSLLAVIVIITLAFGLFRDVSVFPYIFLAVLLVVLINSLAKKIASFYLDSEINIRTWQVRRYGFRAHDYFKRPFQAGLFFPIITSLITLGHFVWMACLVFDVKPKIHRAAKRHGLYSYSEMTEEHIGWIAAAGIAANLVFAVVGYLIGFSELAKMNIYFALFNILPLSDLDGNKIFFGSKILWSFLAALVLIGIGYVFLLI
jgi:Zn-dependent protease